MKNALIIGIILTSIVCGCGYRTDKNQNNTKQVHLNTSNLWLLKYDNVSNDVPIISIWKPQPLKTKSNMIKTWFIDNIIYETQQPQYRVIKPYRSYPNGWGIYSDDIFINSNNDKTNRINLSWLIEPSSGKHKYFEAIVGITDGERIYIDSYPYFYKSSCLQIKDMKEIWQANTIGGICSQQPVFISNGCLLYVDTCIGIPNKNIKRVDPITGITVWSLDLNDSNELNGKYGISLYESNSKYLILKVGKTLRNEDSSFIGSEAIGFYKINPSDGSVSKVNIDPKYNMIKFIRCDEMILMKTLNNKKFLIYNPENDEVVEHDIIKQTGYNVTNNTYMQIDYILENKLLISLSDSIESARYFTYDFKSRKLTSISKENVNSVQAVNGSLIVEHGDKSECIDPETQETLWTIEYQNGGSVQWLDWRGVLTFQENQLVCYAPKK